MKLINPSVEYLPQATVPSVYPEGYIQEIYKQIERCSRTCYKSEDKITEDSAPPFVQRMITSQHTAMLEAGTIYLIGRFSTKKDCFESEWVQKYLENPYSKVIRIPLEKKEGRLEGQQIVCVTTNLRVLQENDWLDELEYIVPPSEDHEKRYTFKMITSIGVTRELNRHRTHSIAEQSTRYCNYSKDKFGNEVTFCKPVWCPDYDETDWDNFLKALYDAEKAYFDLLNKGWQPQQAREVLPLCTATEIVHTAFASDWRHFFDLRLFEKTGAVHPNMKQLAQLLKVEAEKAGIWDDIMRYPSKFN